MVRDLRDVQQAVGARHDLDEGAEVGDALHLAEVGLVELGRRRELLDHADGLGGGGLVGRRHVDLAVVLDVDLHAGLLDDAADHLAAGPDDVADLVDRNLDGDDARRVGRHAGPRGRQRLVHDAEDVQAAGLGLGERGAHHIGRDAGDLDVHLQRGDAAGRAGDLEVHVAVVVFGAGDVAQHRVLAGGLVHDEAHGHAGHRSLQRHTGIHHRQRAAAHRGHRRGAVALEDVRHDAHGVGEVGFGRHHRRQRALGEGAVADFATAGTAHRLGLAHRERREVVVEHEALPHLAVDHLDLLLIVGGAERGGDERLCLTAREHGGAVHAGQHLGLDADRTDLVELAAVETHAAVEDLGAQHLLLQLVQQRLGLALLVGERLGQGGDGGLLDLGDGAVVLDLALDAHGRGERRQRVALDERLDVGVHRHLGLRQLLAACLGGQRVDAGADLLDGRVRGLERLDDFVFRHFLRAGLDHHDAVLASGDREIQAALLALRERRVDDELAVDQSHAHAGDGLLERHFREGEGRRGAGDGQHVGIVFGVGREHEGDDLRLEAPSGGEERADRAVDQAARERFLLGGLAFALEEAARDAARRVGVFTVVDRERKEVDALAGARRVAGRDDHHRVAHADDGGAVGLLGQPTRLDGEGVRADLNLALDHVESSLPGSRSPDFGRTTGRARVVRDGPAVVLSAGRAEARTAPPSAPADGVTCGCRAA